MSEFKGTEIGECAGDSETLVITPSFHQNYIYDQVIFVAEAEDTVSVVGLQYYDRKGYKGCDITHFWFTPEEIDILVKGLLEAKEKVLKIENDHKNFSYRNFIACLLGIKLIF